MVRIHRQVPRPLAFGAATLFGVAFTLATFGAFAAKEKKMLVEYVRYEVPAHQHEAFLAAYRAAAVSLAEAPECLHYEIAQGVEEPNNFVVRIEWQSQEAHERGFRQGPHFAPFFAKVKPFFTNIREMKHYRVDTEGRGKGGAAVGG